MPPKLPDLLIIGDSHSNALVDGCKAHGLSVEMLRFSGNFWHAGDISFHADHGLWIAKPPNQQQQILDLRKRLGGRSVLSPDIPILASLGYHLGRIVPPFGLHGHVTDTRHFAADVTTSYASQALTDAYLGAFRGGHVRLARRMAQAAPMIIVAPPLCNDPPNMRTFHDSITRRMRAVRLNVYDPNTDLFPTGTTLPADYITEDGVHGNAKYGAAVIGKMLAQGLIKPRA